MDCFRDKSVSGHSVTVGETITVSPAEIDVATAYEVSGVIGICIYVYVIHFCQAISILCYHIIVISQELCQNNPFIWWDLAFKKEFFWLVFVTPFSDMSIYDGKLV